MSAAEQVHLGGTWIDHTGGVLERACLAVLLHFLGCSCCAAPCAVVCVCNCVPYCSLL